MSRRVAWRCSLDTATYQLEVSSGESMKTSLTLRVGAKVSISRFGKRHLSQRRPRSAQLQPDHARVAPGPAQPTGDLLGGRRRLVRQETDAAASLRRCVQLAQDAQLCL